MSSHSHTACPVPALPPGMDGGSWAGQSRWKTGKLLVETCTGRALLCGKVRGGWQRQNISLRSGSKRGGGCAGRALGQGPALGL